MKLSLTRPFRIFLRNLSRGLRTARSHLPALTFITLHYLYFILTCLVGAVIFYLTSTPHRRVSFTDSLFLTVSAMSLTGLNTINLSTLNSFQQALLFVLIMLGSAIFVSGFVVHVRLRAFEATFQSVLERRAARAGRRWYRSRSSVQSPEAGAPLASSNEKWAGAGAPPASSNEKSSEADPLSKVDPSNVDSPKGEKPAPLDSIDESGSSVVPTAALPETERPPTATAVTFASDPRKHRAGDEGLWKSMLSLNGVGASGAPIARLASRGTSLELRREISTETNAAARARSVHVARNSSFHHLTEEDRMRLGGREYKAVEMLAWLVPAYFVLWQLLGCLALGGYIAVWRPNVCRENGLAPWWVGAFNAVSAFNNSGMSLLDANMVAFNDMPYILITMGLLILAGNTCYPIFLRLIVWVARKLTPDTPRWADTRSTLQFLLDHPRRCYTHLFPAEYTWWLGLSVLVLNGIDCAAFAILNASIGNRAITHLSPGLEFLDGLFQALAVRHGGFYVVPLPSVRVSLQVLYVIMMYVSAFPVAITMRNSNVYEERSLGIYVDDCDFAALEPDMHPLRGWMRRRVGLGSELARTKRVFVQQQLRAQLAHDIWWLVFAVFLIMVVEGARFERDPTIFSVFNVIFEVVSGYGNVGISIGLPDEAYSFSGAWRTLSKLILCAVMLRGRHRGLPVAIDKAVLLPRDGGALEEEDAQIRGGGGGEG
ncbi:TrkH-domain-containing protein [Trichodelitschia bisporula]|uniref:Potassium transport protein n=1 Tax=Trichodelitschia bisporula TaxID=703511 RepID=A0A6G1I161_9PEZI|nr:TrkH-domain-containing protein [Trichodelitschia bisporula]